WLSTCSGGACAPSSSRARACARRMIARSESAFGYPTGTCKRKRSSCASGSGKVPSCSMGFCVAITRNNGGSGHERRPIVTWCSAIASSNADCTLAGARLISSASTRLWNSGPGSNSKAPVAGRSTSVPVRSAGSRSGVNCTRWKSASMREAKALIAVVLAKPGAPSTNRCPSASSAISSRLTSVGWPMTSVCSASRRARKRAGSVPASLSPANTCAERGSVCIRPVDHTPPQKFCRDAGTKSKRRGSPAPFASNYLPFRSFDRRFLTQDVRRDEHQQLGLVVDVLLVAEQRAEDRDVAEERHLGHVMLVGEFVHATEHHRLPVVDQDRGVDLAMVDLRHETAARIRHQRADGVLDHLELHEDAVVGGDGRGDIQFQHRVLELHGRGALATTGPGVLEGQVADLLALLDRGFLVVRGHHLRLRNGLATAFLLRGR